MPLRPGPSVCLPPCPAGPGSVSGRRSVRCLVVWRRRPCGEQPGAFLRGRPILLAVAELDIRQNHGHGATHLLLVVQALVVVLELGRALLLGGLVLAGGVDGVAGEHLLPEGEAPAGA